MDAFNPRRIVLLGKSGVGKSSLANNIFGEPRFKVRSPNDSERHRSLAETKSVGGRSVTLIDTPGFFGSEEANLKAEMLRCVIDCAPGPHAFLIVLKVEKFTEQEKAVITRMGEYFPEDALRYAAVVFTHGDQLPEGMRMEEYVGQSDGLSELVAKCGGRCHVVDNRYWKNAAEGDYRSNQSQVAVLLHAIETLVSENHGAFYTDAKLQEVEREIQEEEERIGRSARNATPEEIRKQARAKVLKNHVDGGRPTWNRGLVGTAMAIAGLFVAVLAVLIRPKLGKMWETLQLHELPALPEVEVALDPSQSGAVVEQVLEVVTVIEPATVVEQVVEPATVVEKAVQAVEKAFVAVLNRLYELYERTYNPWNPFE